VLENVPEKYTRKDKLLLASREAQPLFLTRYLQGEPFKIESEEWKALSPGLQRYWQVKQECLDKILFY
jgi:hypothetical protein